MYFSNGSLYVNCRMILPTAQERQRCKASRELRAALLHESGYCKPSSPEVVVGPLPQFVDEQHSFPHQLLTHGVQWWFCKIYIKLQIEL